MFRIKDVNIKIVCLIFFITGIQAGCTTVTEPVPTLTGQHPSLLPTGTPNLPNTSTETETLHPTISPDLIIIIPNGNPANLDGTISAVEWKNAKHESFSDGSELLLMHNEGYLYLGIRANTPGMIVGNIFINQNDQVAIFHSSAALGTAIYEKRSNGWEQIQAFSWRCRSTTNSLSAKVEREAFFQQEHWLANNSRMGTPQELEYKIAMPEGSLRMAVTFTRASNTSTRIYWPASLEDESTVQPRGEYPTIMQFSPTTWMAIVADNTDESIQIPTEPRLRSLDQMTMVFVPSGTFQMGSTEAEVMDAIAFCKQHYSICNDWFYMREYPQHTVTLNSFWIDQTEVTNTQYLKCVEAGVCTEPTICKKGESTYYDIEKADHPVVCVSWGDAKNYCEWVGARLPSEAEWEYAFRGEQNLIYPWGNVFDGTKLNYCDVNCDLSHADGRHNDRYVKTAPVGSHPEDISWCGAFDLSGNISEWVADWSESYSGGLELNSTGPISGTEKILRGCNWYFQPAYCRGAARPSALPDTRFDYLGFRCAASDLP